MSNRRNTQFTYNPHNKATVLDCSFIVDSTNGNGFGARSLKKSGRINKVYMNTSAAFTGTSHTSVLIDGIASGTSALKAGMPVQGSGIPAGTTIAAIVSSGSINLSAATSSSTTGSITYQAVGSPNPAAGYIVVQLQDNYNAYLGGYASFASPLSGSSITSGMTVGVPYVIVSVGASTNAQWQTAGLPAYIKPAVGAAFVALATSVAGGGAVQAIATAGAGIDHIEAVGDANVMNNYNGATIIGGGGPGMTLIQACFKNTALTAPTNGTVIGMNFYMNDSAQGV